jgi:uncharacterized membrane protein YgcG
VEAPEQARECLQCSAIIKNFKFIQFEFVKFTCSGASGTGSGASGTGSGDRCTTSGGGGSCGARGPDQ